MSESGTSNTNEANNKRKKSRLSREEYRAKQKQVKENLLVVPDGWKEPPITKEDNPFGVVAQSEFKTRFPASREQYFSHNWSNIEQTLKDVGIKVDLDIRQGVITVSTMGRKTYDPFMIFKARDLVKLIARNVDFEQAKKALQDDVAVDIIKIKGMLRNSARREKRKQRLIGPNGSTQKAIELLTDCYIKVYQNTISVMGPHKGLAKVRSIVEDTMKNIHPIYNIKTLMIKRELESNPELRNQSWERFLPKFKKKNLSKRKQPMKKRVKRDYTPFPPPQTESKIDKELESGEYFLKEKERRVKKRETKQEKQHEAKEKREEKRARAFVPPPEPVKRAPSKKPEESSSAQTSKISIDVEGFVEKRRHKESKEKFSLSNSSSETLKKKARRGS